MGFIKKKEDFTCINCGFDVKGTGYTNHCPKCLYGLHVDEVKPGDRKSGCLGVMEPYGVDKKGEEYVLLHKCGKCGKKTRNKVSERDDLGELVKYSSGSKV